MSHEKPTPLPLNKIIKLEIEAQFVSWVFKKGHKIRLVISNGEWPTIWPAPYKAETRLYFGGKSSSRLHLPLFDKKNVRKVKIKEIVTKNQVRELQPIWKVKKENGKIQVEFQDEYLNRIFLNKTDSGQISIRFRRYILVEANKKTPAIARFHGWADIFMKEKRLYAKTEFKMTSDKNFFYTELTREVREKNKLKFRKRWKRKIKRNGL